MDNNNSNIKDGQGEQQQRKRKFNESANDGQPATAGEKQKPAENLSKKKCEHQQRNDDLEFEHLTREDLIKLVRKSAKQAQEFSQRNVQLEQKNAEVDEDLRKKMAEVAKTFSQRIVNLEQEKAVLHADLHQKMAEIVDMHKEVEEKSKEVAKKAKQIDALLTQLNESSHQHQMPTEQEMKIQLSLETWYDMLAFVPRPRLGKIVPMIGDRRFASIVQKFLHEYGEITIDRIEIVAPYEEDPDGHPRIFQPICAQFYEKFRQNGLLDNANLWFNKISVKDIVQPILCHLLPLINGIVSIDMMNSAHLVNIYDAENSMEIYKMNMKMLEETRILTLHCDDPKNLQANRIDLCPQWMASILMEKR